jgi:hypothetical protein
MARRRPWCQSWCVKTQDICAGHGRGVAAFVQRHGEKVTGVVSGWDRLRLQGSLRALYAPEIMEEYLWRAGVLWKDFKGHVMEVTEHIRDAADAAAADAGRPVQYRRGGLIRKEALVEQIRQRDRIEEGLVTVLSAVEPCRTWQVRGDRATKRLHVELGWGKCLHLYFYLIHPLLGLMHLRLQTWFPFLLHVGLNGREWLSRQLEGEGLKFVREDNCFTQLADVGRAQALLDAQLRTRWDQLLDPLVELYHPTHRLLREVLPVDYYWTLAQSEHATDVMFRDRASLAAVYPALVHHSVMSFGAEQVLGFLGRQRCGESEVQTDRRRREPGVRVKHWVDRNSIKLYDKGPVLRSEVTINEPAAFKVYRASEREPCGPKGWRQLRRSVADAPRRAQVSRAASERHLEALSAVACDTALAETLAPVSHAIERDGQRYRALRVFDPLDQALLRAINHVDFTLHGLRHRDLRAALAAHLPAGLTAKQIAGRIGRLLRLLRAHGLLAKVPRTQRYRTTQKGRQIATAVLAAAAASTPQLTRLAA